jgi:hypothetical protein
MGKEMSDVSLASREVVIHAKNIMTSFNQARAQV